MMRRASNTGSARRRCTALPRAVCARAAALDKLTDCGRPELRESVHAKAGKSSGCLDEAHNMLRLVVLPNVGVHLLAEAGEARCSQSGATTG